MATLHLSKEEFNKENRRLHNRINLLTKHVADQKEEIENLKIIIRLLKHKNSKLDEFTNDFTIEDYQNKNLTRKNEIQSTN